jgi:hypothetical protein
MPCIQEGPLTHLLECELGAEREVDTSLSIDALESWLEVRGRIAKHLALTAITRVAKEEGVFIAYNPVNPHSFPHMVRADVQSKGMHVRAKSLRSGPAKGFLHGEPLHHLPLTFPVNGPLYCEENKDGTPFLTRTPGQGIPINVLTTSTGEMITSDIDLLVIGCNREADDSPLLDPQFGELTPFEKRCIQNINQRFQHLVQSSFLNEAGACYRLINHGPANRFSRSQINHIHFPITVALPDGTSLELGEEAKRASGLEQFMTLCSEWQSSGISIHLNPLWGLSACV